ncbi:cysteine-rich receptor-like protein kinase 10 [Nymphaea colorata]|nr:cysteine-rich receptor-like protein kinase 10 [Nymphaea colorata]
MKMGGTGKAIRRSIVLLLLLLILRHSRGQDPYYSCPGNATYATNSTYQANLESLISSLAATAFFNNGFSREYKGSFPDQLMGLALCRGDATPDDCRNCIAVAGRLTLQICANKKSAVLWTVHCLLRYSNESFFGLVDSQNEMTLMNTDPLRTPKAFDQQVVSLLRNLTQSATRSNGSSLMYNTGSITYTNSSSSTTVYGLVQCTRDLSLQDCNYCLMNGVASLSKCCSHSLGARFLTGSCIVRRETYPLSTSAASVSSPAAPPSTDNETSHGRRWAKLLVGIGVSFLVATLCAHCVLYILYRRRHRDGWTKAGNFQGEEEKGSGEPLIFDLASLKAATQDFAEENKLGEGGFGPVYKGMLPNGEEIAVKRLSKSSAQGASEFKNEVQLIAKLQHRNLVRLRGCCLEGGEKMLIYEYVHNRSLDTVLFGKRTVGKQLDWGTRFKIILGIARGLVYLHEDSMPKVIHRDLKASNILLDKELNPKISDFGTAKIVGVDQTRGNTSRIAGTYGYMSPEYAMQGRFSTRSDAFSFGVLLLEIVSGRSNNSFYQSDRCQDLSAYAWSLWNENRALEMVDEALLGSLQGSEALRCIHVGLLCVQEDAEARPTMSAVVLMLSYASTVLPLPLPPAFWFAMKGTAETDISIGESEVGAAGSAQSTPGNATFSVWGDPPGPKTSVN